MIWYFRSRGAKRSTTACAVERSRTRKTCVCLRRTRPAPVLAPQNEQSRETDSAHVGGPYRKFFPFRNRATWSCFQSAGWHRGGTVARKRALPSSRSLSGSISLHSLSETVELRVTSDTFVPEASAVFTILLLIFPPMRQRTTSLTKNEFSHSKRSPRTGLCTSDVVSHRMEWCS
jgi:hypothetical protein